MSEGPIKRLGSSFGTKVLYFGAYERMRANDLRPLVLDPMVIKGLAKLCPDLEIDPTRPTAHHYESYLEVAHNWAAQWGTDPDVIERLLFAYGKESQDAWVGSFLRK